MAYTKWPFVVFLAGFVSLPAAVGDGKLEASLVTLKADAIPLNQAIAEVQKQTGNAVEDLRSRFGRTLSNPALKLEFNKTPFWPALDAVASQAGLRIYPLRGEAAIGLMARDASKDIPVQYSGPFRLAVQRLASGLNLETGAHFTTAHVQIACEPKLFPLLLKIGSESVQVKDGEKLRLARQSNGTLPLINQQGHEWEIRFPSPARSAAKLKELRIKATALVAPEMLTFKFTNPAAGGTEKVKGVTATLQEFQIHAAGATAVIALDYPRNALDLESHHVWVMAKNEIELEKNGVRFKNRGQETMIVEGGPIRLTYDFQGATGKPSEFNLTYRAPAIPVRYPIEASFKDLALP